MIVILFDRIICYDRLYHIRVRYDPYHRLRHPCSPCHVVIKHCSSLTLSYAGFLPTTAFGLRHAQMSAFSFAVGRAPGETGHDVEQFI